MSSDNATTPPNAPRDGSVIPEWLTMLSGAYLIVAEDLGFLKSAQAKQPMDAGGKPLPMYSYALIEYLAGLDLSAKTVFEFGAGASTLWWAAHAKNVDAAESDSAWVEKLRNRKPENCRIDLVERGRMPAFFRDRNQRFDIIVVDCAENRYDCSVVAREKLTAGGVILLDNSDWYPNTAKFLRGSGLLQVDFHGLRPCHGHACTSTLFFDRAFQPAPIGARLPLPPIGGRPLLSQLWDKPST